MVQVEAIAGTHGDDVLGGVPRHVQELEGKVASCRIVDGGVVDTTVDGYHASVRCLGLQ